MTGVLTRRFRRGSRLPRFAAALALIAQAVGVAVAPSAEAFASRSAPAHVEPAGTQKHHAHNPATCPACIALQLSASSVPTPATPPMAIPARHAPPRGVNLGHSVLASRVDPKAPRAPPVLLVAAR